jgi:hypothetical protein
MNRIISLVLIILLLSVSILQAGAATSTYNTVNDKTYTEDVEFYHNIGNTMDSDGDSQDVEFYHDVVGTYTVSIPASIKFSNTGRASATVKFSNVNLVEGSVSLAISSGNYSDGWNLTSKAGDLKYSINVDGNDLPNNGVALSCANGTELASKELSFTLLDTPKTVSYTDILTFTVSVNG